MKPELTNELLHQKAMERALTLKDPPLVKRMGRPPGSKTKNLSTNPRAIAERSRRAARASDTETEPEEAAQTTREPSLVKTLREENKLLREQNGKLIEILSKAYA